MTDEELIERYITDTPTADPHKRNEPLIKRTGTPVWAVVGYCLHARDESVEAAAEDYALIEDEVRAALAYYRHHPEMDIRREGEERAADVVP